MEDIKKGMIKREIGSYEYTGNGATANIIAEALAISGFDIVVIPTLKDYIQVGEKVTIYSADRR